MMIRNVIFDVGNVLIEFDWEKFLRNLFDEETAKTVSPAMWGTAAWDEMDRGVLSMDEVTALFIANAPDYEPQIREALDRVSECASVKPYTIGWIRELKAKGFHVYYLSNYFQRIRKFYSRKSGTPSEGGKPYFSNSISQKNHFFQIP